VNARHWDTAYREGADAVSWFEPSARVSLDLIASLDVPVDAPLLDIGGGASPLAAELAALGYRDLTVLDLSAVALQEAQARTNADIRWLCGDVLSWRPERQYRLWHDRALLHFFTSDDQARAYVQTLNASLAQGGFVVLGTFAPDGPERCSGLPVRRYSANQLAALVGDAYQPVAARSIPHLTPRGTQQAFTWAAFQRRA
jgi:trans-aconitate methyltransferase